MLHGRFTRRRLAGSVSALGAAALVASTGAAAVADEGGGGPDAAAQAALPEATVLVNPDDAGARLSPMLTGVNNDQWFENSHGLWDPAAPGGGAPDPDVVAKTDRAGIGLVRYPGGTPGNLFDWTRAIGPADQRGCQTDGRAGNGAPRDSGYGPDEHMEFVTAAGAQASIVEPFVRSTPAQAAGWVEYMNASAGTNPGGGYDWAAERAANGNPEPYGVRFWEIGNEHDRTVQRYWMSADTETALRQYAFGGTQRQSDQLLGRGCDFRGGVASDATPDQVFSVAYPPVVPDSQIVTVGGEQWTEVADLAAAGPDERVYTIDDATGDVRFGDGEDGAIPPAGAQVRADYDSGPHAGFVDFYAAMKAVDPSIDVCATWAPITADTGYGGVSFPQVMAEAGHGDDYDCLIVHPYTNFRRDFGDTVDSARQLHDWHMLGEARATKVLEHHARTVEEYGRADAYITTSEFGALFFGPHDASEYRSWNTAMSHATYMASQWTRLADLGVPWAEGNTLISEAPQGLRAVLGGEPKFVYTADAVVREALAPLLGDGTVVRSEVRTNPVVSAAPTALGDRYDALTTTAVRRDDGGLSVVVVNRHPERDVTARIVPAGYRHGPVAAVSTVAGRNDDPERTSFESHNSIDHPDEVRLEHDMAQVGSSAFALTFPKHSVTVIDLEEAR